MKSYLLKYLLCFSISVFVFSPALNAQAALPADSVDSVKGKQDKKSEDKKADKEKRKATYILYAGLTFNTINLNADQYDVSSDLGFDLGAAYKRGGFFYWQVGLRYNNPVYLVKPVGAADSLDTEFGIQELDVPLTVGINFLSATNRLLNLRVFASAIPAFALNVGSNDIGIEKNDLNSVTFYGQAGLGVDVLFLVIETGYNYGFNDLLKNDSPSKPGQVFVNLGIRF